MHVGIILAATNEFKNKLVNKWKREHRYNTIKGKEADDWLVIAYAEDLAVVAPPEIAAILYCRYAYLNKIYNNSVFKPAKNQAFSMGMDYKEIETQLQTAFDNIRQHPTTTKIG